VYPPVDIMQINPLTYCDPANPNGVAKASVNGEVLGYAFDWFVGSVTGTPFYTGSEASGLTSITYSVQATSALSGCVGTKSIDISNEPVKVPSPSVVVLSHRTNCALPNGALQANVNGNTVDYTIQWYDGSSMKNQTDETGEFYSNLDVGPYTTTATDIVSACVSNPIVTEILPMMELPEFEITTIPTNCEVNVGGASIEMLNEVEVTDIVWDIDNTRQFGPIVEQLPKGTFTVTVTTIDQCVGVQSFDILPEILVYNGISRNGDGQNDIFEISCIQDFPSNTVKVFNRAGTLVYQAKGYNNGDISFNGTSNEGLSLLGRELPDGTYFYIIDKGNGSKPKTGYVELLRQ
jgi:gliding motility-associated-like protein